MASVNTNLLKVFKDETTLHDMPASAVKIIVALAFTSLPEYTVDEVAEMCGMSGGTVINQLHWLTVLNLVETTNIGGRGRGKLIIRLTDETYPE